MIEDSFGWRHSIVDNLKQSDEKLVYVYDRLNNECKRKGHKVVTVTAQTVTIPDGDPI